MGSVSLRNLAKRNEYPICVRNIEGHIAPQHTVTTLSVLKVHFEIFDIFLDPPISTEHCDWLYGIFGHETSCTRYWTCWNGTATEQFCIGGLLYNEETHACDWPQNVGGCQKHRKLLTYI